MHTGWVEPDEERLSVRLGFVDELLGLGQNVLVNGLHVVLDALHWMGRERAIVLDFLLTDFAPARFDRGVIGIRRPTMDQIARSDGIQKRLRIGMPKWVFHRVEVVQVAEELIES